MTARTVPNFDPAELNKFELAAASWWDPNGPFKTLHQINPLRLQYIENRVSLANKHILDVGCGGGLLCEAMARNNAIVSGIDLGTNAINVARLHLQESKLDIDYQQNSPEQLVEDKAESYDIITCLEMLEHVPDPAAIVAACAKLVKPSGHLFFSTINRNLKSFLSAIIAAEYVLGLLPQGTHEYHKLIKPSELTSAARKAGLQARSYTGMTYNPLLRTYHLTSDVSINYFAHFVKT